jgi:hypothetical protein
MMEIAAISALFSAPYMDCRAFAATKRLRPRRRVKSGNDDYVLKSIYYRHSRT